MQLSNIGELNRMLHFSRSTEKEMITYSYVTKEIFENSPKNSCEERFFFEKAEEWEERTGEMPQSIDGNKCLNQFVSTSSEPTECFLEIQVFLFETSEFLLIDSDPDQTISQLLKQILVDYISSDKFYLNPLPNGVVTEAYCLFFVDEDTFLPDTNLLLERNAKIKDLRLKKVGLLENPNFTQKNLEVPCPIRKISEITSTQALKVHFEGNSTIISVKSEERLYDLIPILHRKFINFKFFKPEDYEFRAILSSGLEQCVLDMNLLIKILGNSEVTVCKKVFVDSPVEEFTEKDWKSAENEVFIYEPSRFYMNKAQACAYQEFNISENGYIYGKVEKVLGIDQSRIYFMTVAESKQPLKQKLKNNFFVFKMIGNFFKITENTEISISNITAVGQRPTNLSEFSLEYFENGANKTRFFTAENSKCAVEIISKVDILKAMTIKS